MAFQLKIGRKIDKTVSLYKSPSQSNVEFKMIRSKLELTLDKNFSDNTFIVVTVGDIKPKSDQWHENSKGTLRFKLGLKKDKSTYSQT